MDFAKFMSMLTERSLYFARADRLGDPLEGSYTDATREARHRNIRSLELKKWFPKFDSHDAVMAEDEMYLRLRPKQTYISSWHAKELESSAMWTTYLRGGYGVAIRSTFGALRTNLDTAKETIRAGAVRYGDYVVDETSPINPVAAFMFKDAAHSQEQEVRALISHLGWDSEETPIGVQVPIDLASLIHGVRLCPSAPAYFRDLITRVCSDYGVAAPVEPSTLDRNPVY
ncbi:MAG: hypothetical protein ACYDGR_08385 [Candidatus Dormibacteria bacterium]